MAGEPGPFHTEDGEVHEVFLVVVLPHLESLLGGIKRQLGLDPGQEKVNSFQFSKLFCLQWRLSMRHSTNRENEFRLSS